MANHVRELFLEQWTQSHRLPVIHETLRSTRVIVGYYPASGSAKDWYPPGSRPVGWVEYFGRHLDGCSFHAWQ